MSLFYCLYYDDKLLKTAEEYQRVFPDNVILIKVEPHLYYENQALDIILNRKDEWLDKQYVGVFGYKMASKCGLLWDLNKLSDLTQGSEGPDVLGLYPVFRPMFKQSCDAHPKFRQIWKWVINEQLGYPESANEDKKIQFFASNYWCARPQWMLRYIKFYKTIENLLNNSPPAIHDLLYSDARYRVGALLRDALVNISGKPYYTHHPFIMERMPSFFFHTECAKILMLTAKSHPSFVMPKEVHAKFLEVAKSKKERRGK